MRSLNSQSLSTQQAFTATAILLVLMAGRVAVADELGQSTNRPAPLDGHEHERFDEGGFLEREHLLDDPWAQRSALEERGILIEATLIADLSKNISGGVNPAGTFRHLLDFSIALDMDTLVGIEGGTFFFDFQTKEGQDGSVETGDLQAYSNIDAPDFTALYEVWYEQTLFDGATRIKLGKIDVNSEFAFVDHGGEFIHSSPGFSPTLFVLPTYPDPAFGVLGFVGQGDGLYAGAGLFDGALQEGVSTGSRGPSTLFGDPADLFVIGEVGYVWGGELGRLPGRLGVGVWHHTGGFARFDGGVDSHTTGAYIVMNQLLYKENDERDDEQGVGLFAQYGWADAAVSSIEHHIGLGGQWIGALPGRDADVWGVMMSWAGLSDEAGAGFTEDEELAAELFYKIQLAPFVSLKPDIQYIMNPGGAGLDDAWVITARLELIF